MRSVAACALSALALAAAGCGSSEQPTAESSPTPSEVTPSAVESGDSSGEATTPTTSPPSDYAFSDEETYLITLRTMDESADLVDPYSDEELMEAGHMACDELDAGSNRVEISSVLVNAGIDDVVLTAAIPFAAVAALCPDMQQAMDDAAVE